MRIKQKAIPVKVSTLARCAVIALFVIWEFAGWSFGHNPDAGHLPWLDGISKYYNLNNGVPEIIFWINILWATILAGACALICLAIRECALRVFHIEQITISWGENMCCCRSGYISCWRRCNCRSKQFAQARYQRIL